MDCSPMVTSVTWLPRTAVLNSLYEIERPAGGVNQTCTSAMTIRKPSTYQTGPLGRPGPVNVRRSPGRLSRDAIFRGILGGATGLSLRGDGRGCLLDHQSTIAQVDHG